MDSIAGGFFNEIGEKIPFFQQKKTPITLVFGIILTPSTHRDVPLHKSQTPLLITTRVSKSLDGLGLDFVGPAHSPK